MRVEPFSFREFTGEGEVIKNTPARKFTPNNQKEVTEETVEILPPAPTFSEDEMKQAEADGYRKGFLEGTKEGHAQAQSEQSAIDAQLAATAQQFVQHIEPLFNDYRKMAVQLQRMLPQAALAIARKVAGSALADNAAEVVEQMAVQCCQTMIGEPKLTVVVHESLVQTLEGKLKDMATRQQNASQITVVGNAAMPMADCRVEWSHGSMERDTDALWQQVEKVVADMGVSARRDTLAHLENIRAQLSLPPEETAESPHNHHN